MKKHIFLSKPCYLAGLCVILFVIIGVIIIHKTEFSMTGIVPKCVFYSKTGYYCFGCGGTRSVEALLHGDIWKSICYHPFPVYAMAIFMVFMMSYTVSVLSKKRIKHIKLRSFYFYIAIILVILNCLIKNYLLFEVGISQVL